MINGSIPINIMNTGTVGISKFAIIGVQFSQAGELLDRDVSTNRPIGDGPSIEPIASDITERVTFYFNDTDDGRIAPTESSKTY